MAKYTVRTHSLTGPESGIRYAIDFPRVETLDLADENFISFRAWAFAIDSQPLSFIFSFDHLNHIPPNTLRTDVKSYYALDSALCGVNIVLPLVEKFSFGVIISGVTTWLAHVELTQLQVLEGHDNYLFLDNDDNQSVDQYAGRLDIDKKNLDEWSTYFSTITSWLNLNPAKFTFCLAPAKEFIFPELYPVHRIGTTPLDQFISTFGRQISLINPLELLTNHRNLTFTKNDTHWTDFGAHLVAQKICKELEISFQPPDFHYNIQNFTGDLGIKFNPQRVEPTFVADSTSLTPFTYDNGISVRGNIFSISNPGAAKDETCVIFGSSSAETIAKQLSFTFSRVVRVFSGADIDYEIVAHEKPTCIIVVFASRFLIRAPSANFRISSEILRKIEAMAPHEISTLKTSILGPSTGLPDDYYATTINNLLESIGL